jgi:hypothetical protein
LSNWQENYSIFLLLFNLSLGFLICNIMESNICCLRLLWYLHGIIYIKNLRNGSVHNKCSLNGNYYYYFVIHIIFCNRNIGVIGLSTMAISVKKDRKTHLKLVSPLIIYYSWAPKCQLSFPLGFWGFITRKYTAKVSDQQSH